MKRLSDQELEALLLDEESDRVERKQSWAGDAPTKSREAICAFANDLPNHQQPGVLFIGANDDGTPSGLKVTDQLLQIVTDTKTDGNILPLPSLTVEKRALRGEDMVVVTVFPADAPPVRYKGRIWIRIGSRRSLASAQEERVLNERRRFRDLPFDIQPLPSCPIGELNRNLFENEYVLNAFGPDFLEANERTYEERLAACRMILAADEPTPTVLGILTLGNSPRDWIPSAYIQFLRIAGNELSDPIEDTSVIDGPLVQVLRRLDEKLAAHNRQAVDLTSAALEKRDRLYPPAALHQLARNAVMHRTYEATNAPIHLYWFNDRIEIQSPGGPFGVVDAESFGQPGKVDYRNPHLAEVMRVLGYVQRFGVGIPTAQKALRENGNPEAAFETSPSVVVATIRMKPS